MYLSNGVCIQMVEEAVVKVQNGERPIEDPPRGCLREYLDKISTQLPEIDLLIKLVKEAALGNPNCLGQRVSQLTTRAENISKHIITACCKTRKKTKQNNLLQSVSSFLTELGNIIIY